MTSGRLRGSLVWGLAGRAPCQGRPGDKGATQALLPAAGLELLARELGFPPPRGHVCIMTLSQSFFMYDYKEE